MTILQIPADAILMARIAGLMLIFIWSRKKIARTLKTKFGNANIMDEVVSMENIFWLAFYLVLLGVFSYLWPPGWAAWKKSDIFWPAQGLIILAVMGLFSLTKKILSWFFFGFFMIVAILLTMVSISRDPQINPPRIFTDNPVHILEMPEPDLIQVPAVTSTVTVVNIAEDPQPILHEPQVFVKPTTATHAKIDTFYISAPLGYYGPQVVIMDGYKYQFFPLDEVEVMTESGSSFIQKPGENIGHHIGTSRQYKSHCDHETQVMETREWIGYNN